MKKISFIVVALAMVMGMTQCKKENLTENNAPVLEGETYHITLTLNNGSDDAKHEVIPNGTVAPVKFVKDDVIHVAYNGKYAGTLSCSGESTTPDPINGNMGIKLGVFEGDISIAQVGDQPLHFFFLGNKTEGNGLTYVATGGYTTGFRVDITDQTTALPVISYAPSKQNFSSEITNYTVKGNWLLNQCALVKFTSENIYHNGTNSVDNNDDALYISDKQITIKGVNNLMTIDFSGSTPMFTPTQINNGEIKLNNLVKEGSEGNEVRYAVVLAGDYSAEQDLDVAFDYTNDKYGFTGTYQIGKNIAINDYCNDAELRLVWHSGAFKISSSEYVVFSRGNLQYQPHSSKKNWRFAKHQYDYVGGWDGATGNHRVGNVVLDETSGDCDPNESGHWSQNEQIGENTYTGWLDLFGWGTSTNPTKYGGASSSYEWSSDWGTNYIQNSGLTNSSANSSYWTTMTKVQWPAFYSNAIADGRIGFAIVNNVKGVVIFPDNFAASHTTQSGSFTPLTGTGSNLNFEDNQYSISGWKTMEENGAVFLPAAGYRGLTVLAPRNYCTGPLYDQEFGVYWSSSPSGVQPTTQSCYFAWGPGLTGSQTFELDGDRFRYVGHAVRLVHVINLSKSK